MKNSNENRTKAMKILQKAQSDATFRKRLLENPEATLKQEGVMIPPGMRVKFLEREKNTRYFVLPSQQEELSEEEAMKLAAGGTRDPSVYIAIEDYDIKYGPTDHRPL
ncbi:MAG: NHLP leader peptide family RiPP precursor [Chlamydiales bacterium]